MGPVACVHLSVDGVQPFHNPLVGVVDGPLYMGCVMRIWNLTPHPCNVELPNAKAGEPPIVRTIPSDGSVRVEQVNEPDAPVGWLPTVCSRYGGVHGLPAEVRPGDAVIVSSIVADAFSRGYRPEGVTVLVPDTGPTCKRDEQGRILAVRQFIRK